MAVLTAVTKYAKHAPAEETASLLDQVLAETEKKIQKQKQTEQPKLAPHPLMMPNGVMSWREYMVTQRYGQYGQIEYRLEPRQIQEIGVSEPQRQKRKVCCICGSEHCLAAINRLDGAYMIEVE